MRPMQTVRITAYLDGQTVGIGYSYIVTRGGSSWRAFRTGKGLKRFLDAFGLIIDTTKTERHDLRQSGKGRCVTMQCFPRRIDDSRYFYCWDEVPPMVQPYIDIVNGNYVECYIGYDGCELVEFKPNPNSDLYKPLDYWACMAKYS